ncbi:MAG: L-rhamnose mutarotase [Lacunisphaera sp.]|nr:L-rhamnose mutarotase [Lacunisphaera sp.]
MSPYENLLRQEDFRRVGLCALVKPGMEHSLIAAVKQGPPPAQILFRNVHAFTGELPGYSCIFVYLETTDKDVETVPALLRKDPAFAVLTQYLSAHPRAEPTGTPWIRMELINVIDPTMPAAVSQTQHLGYFSRLRPDRELTYRTLHQTNWPGVVDQMARSHYCCWITFLIEIGSDLALFTYCQYVGHNKATDDDDMAADPTTQRWWVHTQPCLEGMAGATTPWMPLTEATSARATIPLPQTVS